MLFVENNNNIKSLSKMNNKKSVT